jgi:hypothetical protein
VTLRIALVSCVKSKRAERSAAKELYTSQLFRGLRAYAETNADAWYVLSAEYGLLHPEAMVEPYDGTLNRMLKPERVAWAERVETQLRTTLQPGAEVILLAGARYREGLEPFLVANGFAVTIPFKGLGLGKQLQKLKELNRDLQ